MKHEVTSFNTKMLLSATLKKLVSQKSFSKITVSEIIRECGVNRKTFYYHFSDVYALLKWTLEQEAIEVIKNFDLIAEYEEAMLFVMDFVDENDDFLNNICNSFGRDELKRFLYTDFIGIVSSVVDRTESLLDISVSSDYKEFSCRFYTEAIAGTLLEWITDKSVRNRELTVRYLSDILCSAIPASLQAAGSCQHNNECST